MVRKIVQIILDTKNGTYMLLNSRLSVGKDQE